MRSSFGLGSKERKTRSARGLISPAPDGLEPVIVCGMAESFNRRCVEPVGEHYEVLMERYWGVEETGEYLLEDEVDEQPEEEEKFDSLPRRTRKKNLEDLYEMLGLGHLRWLATSDQIRQAYRKKALLCHPDKSSDKDDTLFKAVNRAWSILGDDHKRRQYDSSEPFDDRIPNAGSIGSDREFYAVFGVVFKRNAKWSKRKPVPDLGNEQTPIDQVKSFYKFWSSFQSWRDFAYLNEYNVEEAENRQERRFMEKQNSLLQSRKLREESARVSRLVSLAYSLDPRIRAESQEAARKKEKRRKEKSEAANAEKERKSREQAAQEQERIQREEESRKRVKALEEKLRSILVNEEEEVKNQADTLISHKYLTEKTLNRLVESGNNDLERVIRTIRSEHSKMIRSKDPRFGRTQPGHQTAALGGKAADDQLSTAEWTQNELSLLVKALSLYPGGTVDRWKHVAAHLNHRRTEADIISRVKAMRLEMKSGARTNMSTYQKNSFGTTPKNSENSNKLANGSLGFATQQDGGRQAAATGPARSKDGAAAGQRNWTTADQAALEQALKKYSPLTPNRWDLIAQEVPGRTKLECIERFKYLVDIIKKKN
ncbi:dnaJ homolog subfamily C member 2-like [Schistocerca gregaria]|uniref:dnaJ homolog subfamily C member 2-like n=1 Tax=Schistocerca gregaria TaxID=7010 RepID=UPI00211E3071|nr:dnaJ homolog subfamily C member 2-like [Schistocerca gregaria]